MSTVVKQFELTIDKVYGKVSGHGHYLQPRDPARLRSGDAMAAIEIQGVTKRFGSVLAVDDLTFSVPGGAVTGFLGQNGAGKTTMLRILLGLVEPTEGRATIDGQPYRDLADPLYQVGAVLEASSFYPGRTARNHLRVHAASGDIDPRRVPAVLETVGLGDAADRRIGGFSLGMRQRLGLATALLGDPGVLILDEPANGLDPEGVRWLRHLLRGFADEGRTVLFSSHVLPEVAQTVDSVVILDRGRMAANAPLEQLTASAGVRPVVRIRTSKAEQLRAAVVADGADAHAVAADRIEVIGSTAERVAILAAELRIPIFESLTETANLEEVFFQLTADHAREGH
jgi:ABC-2 type transport system ATP-binding protein